MSKDFSRDEILNDENPHFLATKQQNQTAKISTRKTSPIFIAPRKNPTKFLNFSHDEKNENRRKFNIPRAIFLIDPDGNRTLIEGRHFHRISSEEKPTLQSIGEEEEQEQETGRNLARRWSDELQPEEKAETNEQIETNKISKTKSFFMKFHLRNSSDDEPRKRVVRRSNDKKRYQTQ